jgi:hypothetical protein
LPSHLSLNSRSSGFPSRGQHALIVGTQDEQLASDRPALDNPDVLRAMYRAFSTG